MGDTYLQGRQRLLREAENELCTTLMIARTIMEMWEKHGRPAHDLAEVLRREISRVGDVLRRLDVMLAKTKKGTPEP